MTEIISVEKKLIRATETNDIATVIELINSGLNVNTSNAFNENLLFIACRFGHLDIVNFLIAHNADPCQLNTGKRSALNAACLGGHLEIVKKLIELSKEPRYVGLMKTLALAYGFYPKNFHIFDYLLKHGFVSIADIKTLPLDKYQKIQLC